MDRLGRARLEALEVPYDALPSQRRFHNSTARFRGFSGPIGSGKSKALIHEALRCAYVNAGRWGLIGAPTYQMLRDATQKPLFEVLEKNNIPYSFNKSENTLFLKKPRATVLLRSMEDCERLRGTNLAWFGLDELTYTQEAAWLRLEGRLRDPGAKRMTGFAVWTPKGFDWVYEKFVRDKSKNYDVTMATPFENRHILGKVPDFYERLRSSYDAQFFEQEVLGSYVSLSGGLVYRNFSREHHVRGREADPTTPLLWALDFNVNPLCSVVVQGTEDGVQVVDEIVMSHATTDMACQEFLARHGKHPAGFRIYGDASGNNSHTSGSTDYQIITEFFRRLGISPHQTVPKSNPLVRDRISLVNATLRSADGEIGLYVSPKCRGLIADFEQLSYKEGTTIPDKEKDAKRSHLSDALGYVLWQEFRTGKVGEKGWRLG